MSSGHLDLASLESLREVMGEDFPQLVDTFIADSDMRLEAIGDAITAAHPEAILRTAHSLKGSASNMGAIKLSQLCRSLEEMGFQGKSDGAQAIYAEVIVEYAAVRIAIKASCS